MTWKEFKEFVDQRLTEQGADENIAIWRMDFAFPRSHHLVVRVDVECGLEVVYLGKIRERQESQEDPIES